MVCCVTAPPLDVVFLLTEESGHLTPERRRRYDEAAGLLAGLAGKPPRVLHYTEVDDLDGASAIVVSGSDAPWAAHDPGGLERLRGSLSRCGRPVLGVCAGMQLLAECAGGVVGHAGEPERGYLPVEVLDGGGLLAGLSAHPRVYLDHTDEIVSLPDGFRVLARSPACAIQAIVDERRRFWGTQFHPERAVDEHPAGRQVLENFFAIVRDS